MAETVESKSPSDIRLTGVFVYRRNRVFVRGIVRSVDEKRVPHGFVARRADGAWNSYMIENGVTSFWVLDEPDWKVLSLCADGSVHVKTARDETTEHVDPSGQGPNPLRRMLDLRAIGNSVYAVGMARMVYRRIGPGMWTPFGQGTVVPREEFEEVGFLAIDGLDESSIYAVGLAGEIWHCDGHRWRKIDSPTNVPLHRVRCVSPDIVYVCGAAGVILRGRGNSWSIIPQEETNKTLWGLDVFGDTIYFADGENLYALRGDEFAKVDMELEEPPAVSYLHSGDGVLWTVGRADMAMYDGVQWTRIYAPGSSS